MIKLLKKIIHLIFFWLPAYLREQIIFEIISKIGRLVTPSLHTEKNKSTYINLGSGSIKYDGFINVDFFWGWGVDYGADLRFPLKIRTNSIDGIFCEHTLEHLTYSTNALLLSECYRILKPGSIIRIIVPDVSIFIEKYINNDLAWFDRWKSLVMKESTDPTRNSRFFPTKMSIISVVTQEFGHVAAWDFETFQYYLKSAGFGNIKKCEFRKGSNDRLLLDIDSEDRKLVSLYIEAVKI